MRVALGATRRGIPKLVARGGLPPALVGSATGVVASLGPIDSSVPSSVDVPFWDPLTLAVSGVENWPARWLCPACSPCHATGTARGAQTRLTPRRSSEPGRRVY